MFRRKTEFEHPLSFEESTKLITGFFNTNAYHKIFDIQMSARLTTKGSLTRLDLSQQKVFINHKTLSMFNLGPPWAGNILEDSVVEGKYLSSIYNIVASLVLGPEFTENVLNDEDFVEGYFNFNKKVQQGDDFGPTELLSQLIVEEIINKVCYLVALTTIYFLRDITKNMNVTGNEKIIKVIIDQKFGSLYTKIDSALKVVHSNYTSFETILYEVSISSS